MNSLTRRIEEITRRNGNFRYYKLSPEVFRSLLQVLPTDLVTLDLRDTGISDAEVILLCKVLPKLTFLQDIYLGYNSIGSNGANELFCELKNLQNLKTIHLNNNAIGSDAVGAFVNCFRKNQALSELDLSYNVLDGLCAADIRNFLLDNTSLKKLSLSYNNIGPEGIELFFTMTH